MIWEEEQGGGNDEVTFGHSEFEVRREPTWRCLVGRGV